MDEPATDGSSRPTGRFVVRRRWWIGGAAAVAVLGIFIWASDRITLKGERTIYTVDCRRGVWEASRCTGQLVLGPRYRFKALRPQGEVLFWTVGASAPSGKFTDCAIVDGRNWQCQPSAAASSTITLQMALGRPVPSQGTMPFHAVPKGQWWLMRLGSVLGFAT
jgi:hypothetical protein